jgi:hypothetical protein
MTMINQTAPEATPAVAFTALETQLLDRLVPDQPPHPALPKTLALYLTKLARLGGYLARARNPPPGNTVLWRGLARLSDIALGVTVASACG